MTFWKCFHHMPNGNIWNLFKMLFSFLYVIMMFPKWTNCDQDVLKTNQCDQNVPTNHMVKTFSECHWGNFKCCINVPIGSRSNTWSGNIWNVPNLLLVGKWWVPSTRAYNVLKMFSLVSRPPHPQCIPLLCTPLHLGSVVGSEGNMLETTMSSNGSQSDKVLKREGTHLTLGHATGLGSGVDL